jgi:HPt (histidine-containing phosphotransfer) domain-containing protein
MYSKRISHLLDPVEFFSRQEVVGYMRDIVQMLTESQKKVLTAMYGLDGEEPCERRDLEHRFKGELAYGTAFHHLVRAKQRIRYIISQNHRGALLNE